MLFFYAMPCAVCVGWIICYFNVKEKAHLWLKCAFDMCIFKYIYLLRCMLRSLYSWRNQGSRRDLIKWMASPVLFISGPNSLLTFGNLLKLNTGSFTA